MSALFNTQLKLHYLFSKKSYKFKMISSRVVFINLVYRTVFENLKRIIALFFVVISLKMSDDFNCLKQNIIEGNHKRREQNQGVI